MSYPKRGSTRFFIPIRSYRNLPFCLYRSITQLKHLMATNATIKSGRFQVCHIHLLASQSPKSHKGVTEMQSGAKMSSVAPVLVLSWDSVAVISICFSDVILQCSSGSNGWILCENFEKMLLVIIWEKTCLLPEAGSAAHKNAFQPRKIYLVSKSQLPLHY